MEEPSRQLLEVIGTVAAHGQRIASQAGPIRASRNRQRVRPHINTLRAGDISMKVGPFLCRVNRLRFLAGTCVVSLCFHAGAAPVAPARPEIFAPGTISATGNVNAITFSPEGDRAWFDEVAGGGSTIMQSHRVDGIWSRREIASFSGEWRDLDPAMSPDGSFIVFCSNRPDAAGGRPLDAHGFDGRLRPGAGSHLWRVDRLGSKWGDPYPLPPVVNDDTRLYSPSVARDGTLWFQHPDASTRTYHLMRSEWRDGRYQDPVEVHIGPPEFDERDPAVAPDESFVVFSTRNPASGADGRLVISFRSGLQWSEPQDLGEAVNHDGAEGPHLGADGRTLYFDSTATFQASYPRTRQQTIIDLERARLWDNGNSHLWAVRLDSWLDQHQR
jgi:Tol biopolymer transport system component